MANFLRDQQIKNLSINEDTITQINQFLLNQKLLLDQNLDIPEDGTYLTYIIRFDGKGYRLFSLEEMLPYFHQAKEVERIIITLENGKSLRSNRLIGTCLELKLDQQTPNNCNLTVTSDDANWVDANFATIQELLAKYKNHNGYVRTIWAELAVQIIGVTFGFIISLWVATKVAPKLRIENAFLISFLFILVIFSNTWSYINQKILSFINKCYPNLKFYRYNKDKMHWIYRSIIGGVAGVITIWLIGELSSFVGNIISGFI